MKERFDKNFTVIETKGTVDENKQPAVIRHTNPIMKKALEFQKENKGKFSVKDLFKP